MLPLYTQANINHLRGARVLKVVDIEEARQARFPAEKSLIWLDQPVTDLALEQFAGAVIPTAGPFQDISGITIENPKTEGVIAPGDVIRVQEGSSRISVFYRRGSNSNTLMATERCNSFCVMCSQPPREVDDRWFVQQMLDTIPLIDQSEKMLGLSGGEPTLLGDDLAVVLHQARSHLPETVLHILSNGRRFSDPVFCQMIAAVNHPHVQWGIPLYSDDPGQHDYIVQSHGAWHETVEGLYNLARVNASIEIRVVVQKSNVDRLSELARFIFHNLSFVDHIAFMALEPMGFARTNHSDVWIDPIDCQEQLFEAVSYLSDRGMNPSLYNFPLCTVSPALWDFSRQSISDWKNVYLPECEECAEKSNCCGFFRTIDPGWTSRSIHPIEKSPHPEFEEAE
jgi:His-Xaa-Ser system radical SAM maturase HxsC